MEFKFAVNQELSSIKKELEEKRQVANRARAHEHDHAARRIKSSLWDADQRFRKLSEDLEFSLREVFKKFPGIRGAELLLDRRLTKKEELMGKS